MSSNINRRTQTVILSKSRFKTLKDALVWIHERGFADVPQETSTSYRFSQSDPDLYKESSFYSENVALGVTLVSAIPRKRKSK